MVAGTCGGVEGVGSGSGMDRFWVAPRAVAISETLIVRGGVPEPWTAPGAASIMSP